MARDSDPLFRTLHALRIKGFATVHALGVLADLTVDCVQQHLAELEARDWARFRAPRELWQLTPAGREHHRLALAEDVRDGSISEQLRHIYPQFLALNQRFKALCGQWQLRDGVPNDHRDAAYDRDVVAHLVVLNADAVGVITEMGRVLDRYHAYVPRLAAACERVVAGQTNMFTGVMCGSYHDVWMELHEDLILTQDVDRVAEGSF